LTAIAENPQLSGEACERSMVPAGFRWVSLLRWAINCRATFNLVASVGIDATFRTRGSFGVRLEHVSPIDTLSLRCITRRESSSCELLSDARPCSSHLAPIRLRANPHNNHHRSRLEPCRSRAGVRRQSRTATSGATLAASRTSPRNMTTTRHRFYKAPGWVVVADPRPVHRPQR
jgi:hypothetical protein